jgi:hypothetical protein
MTGLGVCLGFVAGFFESSISRVIEGLDFLGAVFWKYVTFAEAIAMNHRMEVAAAGWLMIFGGLYGLFIMRVTFLKAMNK